MFIIHLSVVACAFLSQVLASPFQRLGNQTNAPTWNQTSISTTWSSPATITSTLLVTPLSTDAPPYPISSTESSFLPGTGIRITSDHGYAQPTGKGSNGTNGASASNVTGPDCTVNIPQASVDWWFAATYEWSVGQLTRFNANSTDGKQYLTNIPNTDTFDVTSALSDVAWTNSEVYDPEWDMTWTYLEEYTVKPSATITSVISRTGYLPLPSDNIIPETDTPLYDINLTDIPPATLAVAGPNRTVFIATSTTPVLYFSAYEVETAVPVTADDGRVSSTTVTETFNLPQPYANSYWIKGIEDSSIATGQVPSDFLAQIPQSSCSAGTFQAVVTVLVVVDLFWVHFPHANPFIVHIESTALGFDDPPVVVQETKNPASSKAAQTFNVPMIEETAPGFTNVPESIKPAVQHTSQQPPANPAPNSPSENHNGDGSPAQGPNAPEPTQHTVGTIGTAPVVIGPSSVVVVGGQTVTPGGPPITVGGNPVSLVPSGTAIVVGTKTSNLPQVAVPQTQPRPPPIITVGSTTLTANAATQFFVGPGQTLTPGGTATIGGQVVSLGSSANFVVVGGSTQALAGPAAVITQAPSIVVGGSTVFANPGSSFVFGGQTLAPGQQITVDGTQISLAPEGTVAVINGVSSTLSAAIIPARPSITVGGSVITASPDGSFTIDNQVLSPGQVITVSGTTLSLGPSASFIVVNGVTSALANPAAQITAPPLTIGNGVFTAQPGSGTTYIIGDHTLTPGGAITVGDTTISLAPGATALIINGQTTYLNPSAPITNPPLLTIGTDTFTALPGTGTTFVIDGQTLTPGGVITVDGTTISLSPGATELVYGSSGRSTTTALFPATTTRSQSITSTDAASAGQTGENGVPTQTNSKGAAHSVVKSVGLESWVLSLMISFLGLVFG